MNCLLRTLGIERQDAEAGVMLSALAGCCLLSCYYLIQPLSDAMALHVGVENTPWITVGNLTLIALANPLYSMLAKALPPPRILPALYRFLGAIMIFFAVGFLICPGDNILSFSFAIFIGVFSLFLTTTFWARMASLHSKEEAKRVYGIISAGSQSGQLLSSLLAAFLFSSL